MGTNTILFNANSLSKDTHRANDPYYLNKTPVRDCYFADHTNKITQLVAYHSINRNKLSQNKPRTEYGRSEQNVNKSACTHHE